MEKLSDKTIGEIVATDFRTAAVFTKHRIDFCCGGEKTVGEACAAKQLDTETVTRELQTMLDTKAEQQIDFQSWPLDLLTTYITRKHHRYVTEKTPVLQQYLHKLVQVHGDRHPELAEVEQLFADTALALAQHMKKEELVLFPFVEKMVAADLQGEPVANPPFGTVQNPIAMMKHEHDTEGERLRKIAELTNGYTPPEDACSTYRVTFAMLQEFEQDLHEHIHLENNILFPRAIRMEKGEWA